MKSSHDIETIALIDSSVRLFIHAQHCPFPTACFLLVYRLSYFHEGRGLALLCSLQAGVTEGRGLHWSTVSWKGTEARLLRQGDGGKFQHDTTVFLTL